MPRKNKAPERSSPFGEVIYSYTRAQAISDGVLIDVTKVAREAGFIHPTVVSQTLWNMITQIPELYRHEDQNGRLWDVVWMAYITGKRPSNKNASRIEFGVILHTKNEPARHETDQTVRLLCDCGPGDYGEPVITIGLPEDF
jgi:hypothetical protein